jgi:hypothetical protein
MRAPVRGARAPALVAAAHRHSDRASSMDDDNCAHLGTTSRNLCIVRIVSTRAIVAYTSMEGTWKGVWNDSNSEPQQLGRVLVRRVASQKGDLEGFVAQYVEGCPEGWVALEKAERCADPIGFLSGRFDGIVATCDPAVNPLCFDAQYLYLVHPPKRRLFVFRIEDRPMRPFGMVTFDPAGKAKPPKLPAVEVEA